jgi:hypothetical protein
LICQRSSISDLENSKFTKKCDEELKEERKEEGQSVATNDRHGDRSGTPPTSGIMNVPRDPEILCLWHCRNPITSVKRSSRKLFWQRPFDTIH